MKNIEIEINNVLYVITPLDAQKSGFLYVKLSPILAPLVGAIDKKEISKEKLEEISSSLASLDEKTYEYITGTFLAQIKRKEGESFYNVYANGNIMYDEIKQDLFVFFVLIQHSIKLNFESFFASAAKSSVRVVAAQNTKLDMPA